MVREAAAAALVQTLHPCTLSKLFRGEAEEVEMRILGCVRDVLEAPSVADQATERELRSVVLTALGGVAATGGRASAAHRRTLVTLIILVGRLDDPDWCIR